jgi:sodium/potassium-transporting ATPase subunit alpha
MHQGLTHKQAKRKLIVDGPNTLTPPKKQSEFLRFARNLFGGFSILLIVGSIMCFTAYIFQKHTYKGDAPQDNLYLGVCIISVVFITGLFSYYQVKLNH